MKWTVNQNASCVLVSSGVHDIKHCFKNVSKAISGKVGRQRKYDKEVQEGWFFSLLTFGKLTTCGPWRSDTNLAAPMRWREIWRWRFPPVCDRYWALKAEEEQELSSEEKLSQSQLTCWLLPWAVSLSQLYMAHLPT